VPALTLFVACMLCHGELARLKPPPRYLTSFYLTITAGGAAGGLFVGLAAPLLFPGMWEYPIALWLTAALVLATFWRDRDSPLHGRVDWPVYATLAATAAVAFYSARTAFVPSLPSIDDDWLFGAPIGAVLAGFGFHTLMQRRRRITAIPTRSRVRRMTMLASATAALLVFAGTLAYLTYEPYTDTVYKSRNFYGVLHVIEDSAYDPENHSFRLNHGRIVHGKQYQAANKRREPTSYYGRDSGVGLAIHHHPRRFLGLRIGVVGLGVGTLAAYGMKGDVIRFYEINPDVLKLAGPKAETFTYVGDSNARIEFAIGDARIEMERELAQGKPQRFHVLALDAFSSDAIPVHLLTREALDVYVRHLAPDGILAIHISNRSVDLAPVVRALAQHAGLAYVVISPSDGHLTWTNTWALLARDPALLADQEIADAAEKEEGPDNILWTDDYSNLLRVLKL
jgi:spermidine synthase